MAFPLLIAAALFAPPTPPEFVAVSAAGPDVRGRVKQFGPNWSLTLGDATNTTKVSAMFDQGLGMWWAEKAHYDLAANTCQPGQVCGHYTQLVWSSTTKIGCAVALCTPQKPFNAPGFTLACELAAGGNTFGQRPYTASSPAP